MPQSDDWSKTWHSFLLHTWDFSFWRFGGRSSKLEYFSWGLVIFAKWRGQETLRFNYASPTESDLYLTKQLKSLPKRGDGDIHVSVLFTLTQYDEKSQSLREGGYLEPLLDSYEENNLKPMRFNWSRLLILGRVQQVACSSVAWANGAIMRTEDKHAEPVCRGLVIITEAHRRKERREKWSKSSHQ